MSLAASLSVVPGAVFLDNTTLHEASLTVSPAIRVRLGYSSLTQLVEAVVLHEEVYVAGDLLEWDSAAKAVSEKLAAVVKPLPMEPTLMDVGRHCGQIIWKLRETPIWKTISPPLDDPDLECILNRIHLIGGKLRTFHGLHPPSESAVRFVYREALVVRTLLYYMLARAYDLPYRPNGSRAALLLDLVRFLGPCPGDPADFAIALMEEIRRKFRDLVTDAFGVPAIKVEVPVFLAFALKDARTVDDVLENALRLRNMRNVRLFRQWLTNLSENFRARRFQKVVTSLQDLLQLRDALLESLKRPTTIPISIGIPPSISFDVGAAAKATRPLLFLRDIVAESLALEESFEHLKRIQAIESMGL